MLLFIHTSHRSCKEVKCDSNPQKKSRPRVPVVVPIHNTEAHIHELLILANRVAVHFFGCPKFKSWK